MNMKKMLVALLVFTAVLVPMAVLASPILVPLSTDEAAFYQATHVAEITWRDLGSSTSTNTALVFTNALAANTYVECVGARLLVPFDTVNTTYTGSVALTVGVTDATTKYLASMELASDGTEVYWKPGIVTGTPDNPTNVTAVTVAPGTMFLTATNLTCTLTPNAEEALSANKQGKVKVYFRLR